MAPATLLQRAVRAIPIFALCAAGCGGPPAAPVVLDAPVPVAAPPPLEETTVGGIVLRPTPVLDGKLALLMPETFAVMDKQTLKEKYPSSRRPTLVYADETAAISIAINHTDDPLPEREIGTFHAQMDRMFRGLYPTARWYKSEVTQIHGRKWLMLNLSTPALDTEIRNIMIGTSLDDRLLMVTFNVTKELEGKWLDVGEAVIQSIRVEG